jgi:CRP-like cAMP-binding protein
VQGCFPGLRERLGPEHFGQLFPRNGPLAVADQVGEEQPSLAAGELLRVVEVAVLALLGPGECLGEMALFDGKPRSTTATATEATMTFMVSRGDFVAWVSERPAAALALLETLSLRLRRANENMTDLVFLDLSQRLAKELVRLAAAVESGGKAARIQVTQGELASMLGVSRESVNKQLNQFAREGWIKLGRGAVTVLDPGALRRFV